MSMSAISRHVVRGKTTRARPGETLAPSVMRGTVVAVEGGRVWVKLPGVSGQDMHGPVTVMGGLQLAVDDRVLVVSVGGAWADLVVVATVGAGHQHTIGDVEGLEAFIYFLLEAKSDVGHTHNVATTVEPGFMSAAQKRVMDRTVLTPAQVWEPAASGDAAAVSHEWDPVRGWVAWVELSALAGTGTRTFAYPTGVTAVGSARPSGLSMDLILEGVSGVTHVQPRVDYLDGGAVDGQNALVQLQAWPTWGYQVAHDFILPANRVPRPTVALLGVGTSRTGRIGLTAPVLAARSERSQ